MVGSVAGRAMLMPVGPRAREQILECRQQIILCSRTDLHQSETCGGVGKKNVEESITLATAKGNHMIRDVAHRRCTAGADLKQARFQSHPPN